MTSNSKILLTGATGFIGAYMLRLLLNKGYRVRALRRADSRIDLIRDIAHEAEWAKGDVTDLGALEDAFDGITHVCHCAAMVSFHPKDSRRMMQVNVEGTANMVNLALDFGVQKFVHVSSIAALGRAKNRPNLNEKCQWVQSSDNSQYAISKYLSEQEVWRGHAEGLPVAIANPSVVLGSGYWDVGTGKMFKQVHSGLKFWSVGSTGLVDVRDVSQFLLLLLESDISGERFILNGRNTSFRDLFFLIADELDARRPSVKVTPLLAEIAWRVERLKEKLLGTEPIVTKESARASVSSYFYDNAKSLTVPDFTYRPLEQTVQQTAKQFLDALNDGYSPRMLPFN
ncbi:MAG: SDR family NAD(P)-dependent oxidoreductase [Saprospiraceae bacterium]